jgi:hypothetical protein
MAAGMADHVWIVEELVGLLPAQVVKERGPYRKSL